ncbi:alpha/beta hydrolase [Methylobacterium platani]|uniref:Hydrolase n=2 Tax=Methylobacterium platani TaxID=427683 RepID=A0A179S6C0_9HYPH|nr:alpha/beta fold hydrolase [Methylobacterium platani]KMO20015.1 hydrolase [Methylobacterium platani JCM 14648]OAS22757.1 hydrolase [Methylobacterium platani]
MSAATAVGLHARGPGGLLEGTWQPAAPGAPVVLIVPGSGPTDRDGNNPGGVAAGTYQLLAEGLAAHGIASVRVDKRGLFGSRLAASDPNAVTLGDYVDDVGAWIAEIRRRDAAAPIWLLGHSEGGLVALAAAAGAPPDLAGLILAAVPGRPLGEVLREQLAANPANVGIMEEALATLAHLERGERVEAVSPVLRPLFRPEVQGFLASMLRVDPVSLIARLRVPVLILQGGRDIQVGRADAEALHRANPAARLVLLPEANHVFKAVASDDRAANVAAYRDPALPLAPGTVAAIVAAVEGAPRSVSGRSRW